MSRTTTDALYLVTIVTFILALRFLSSPKHARKGNWIGAAGMTLAIVVTLAQDGLDNYALIAIGMVDRRRRRARRRAHGEDDRDAADGRPVQRGRRRRRGAHRARRVPPLRRRTSTVEATSTALSALIGAISFSGSLVAFAKLQELISGRPIVFRGQQIVNALIIGIAVVLGVWIAAGGDQQWLIYGLIVAALVFGVMFVLPIGGADMPVVISLLNAFTGLAASATGFVLHNNVLIVAGALVGASGTLLTLLMGKAMNRSITNVLFGAFGQVQAGAGPRACRRRPYGSGDLARGRRRDAVVRPQGDRRARLRARGRPGAARRPPARRAARGEGRRCRLRDPSGRRPHARSHERAARRGERPVRSAQGNGRDQSGVRAGRRRCS